LLVGRHPRLAAVPLMPGPGAQPGGSGWPGRSWGGPPGQIPRKP